MKRLAILVALFLLASGKTDAHDYWMQPNNFFAKPKEKISVRLFVGDVFNPEIERGFSKKPTTRFELISTGQATIPLLPLGVENKKPFSELRLAKGGDYWLVMDRRPRYIKLTAEKFNKYLAHEGLTNILEERRRLKEDKKPGLERYGRHLKCLLRVGAGDGKTWKEIVKQRLEILPLSNPATKKPGDTLNVRILFEGKPLAKAPLFAYNKSVKGIGKQALHTNEQGIAELRITGRGTWLVRLVHMRRCVDSKEADWESFWGAMSFGIK